MSAYPICLLVLPRNLGAPGHTPSHAEVWRAEGTSVWPLVPSIAWLASSQDISPLHRAQAGQNGLRAKPRGNP